MERTVLLILKISPFSGRHRPLQGLERPPPRFGTSDAEARTGGGLHALAPHRPGRLPSSRAAGRVRPSMTGNAHLATGRPPERKARGVRTSLEVDPGPEIRHADEIAKP